ncbi:MAG: ABC transporter permease subunit [Methylorubrum extorquens]|jgi:ABC-type nitrate/sulfonate/bicarbonate transport system permease component|uniref:ABC transporter permease component (Subunit B) n=1 Tax=Methylorubrum extorquens (strain DSM 6343 / CIP 106787 / DM4) TaxID=661410 RepID=C7C8D6_METED|nr:ABC transporter permease subunit [Methylorubrum extorquens]CAX24143.1 ABC transporter permease component (subunit B) [Methylorubrum extorquens DM4]
MALLARLLSLAVLLVLWQGLSVYADTRTLPAPSAVFAFILREAQSGSLFFNVGVTLARVAVSFVIAMSLGVLLGIALGRSRLADRLLDTPLLVVLNTPALVITVLAYVWLGLTETAAIVAVALNKLPNVAVIMREGARGLDPGLEEMATTYRFDRRTWIAHVLLPQLQPFMVAAARSGISLAWKIVLVVELLGRPNGVGFAINYYFTLFDVTAVIGYSLVFMSVMLALDSLLLQPLDSHVRRWR